MLLADQAELLREYVVRLRNQQLALPLMGGQVATRQTYQFKPPVHPARYIATTIWKADPRGNKLPARLRGWDLDVSEGSPGLLPLLVDPLGDQRVSERGSEVSGNARCRDCSPGDEGASPPPAFPIPGEEMMQIA